jgi:3-dehydroquinate synthase
MVAHKHKTTPTTPLNINWHTSFGVESKVTVGAGTSKRAGYYLSQFNVGRSVLILKQPHLDRDILDTIVSDLEERGYDPSVMELADGEACKSHASLLSVWQRLEKLGFTRQDTLLAIGGGAITDLAGFAASTYLRGINLVLVPTTLLSQVDAAIGGKTAINLEAGKNLAGTFYFPRTIVVDPETLLSLPRRQFASGLAEVIKYGMLEKTIAAETEYKPGPIPLFDFLEENLTKEFSPSDPIMSGIIMSSIKMKLAVVAKDPHEDGLRRCLNLGHTLGHGVEKGSSYQLTHGEAVSIGLAFISWLAVKFKMLSEKEAAQVIVLLKKVELPVSIPADLKVESISEALFHDKKRSGKSFKMVIPNGNLGTVDYTKIVHADELTKYIEEFIAL